MYRRTEGQTLVKSGQIVSLISRFNPQSTTHTLAPPPSIASPQRRQAGHSKRCPSDRQIKKHIGRQDKQKTRRNDQYQVEIGWLGLFGDLGTAAGAGRGAIRNSLPETNVWWYEDLQKAMNESRRQGPIDRYDNQPKVTGASFLASLPGLVLVIYIMMKDIMHFDLFNNHSSN